jgi:hypothetical protein
MNMITILALLTSAGNAFAQIRDFHTTRLNSTAGAGVASILSTEAAILNPASAAFFGDSSASVQSYSTSLRKENSLRKSLPDKFPKNNRSTGYFLADHSSGIKGGIAYIQQNENRFDRERMIFHGSAPVGPNGAVGISYNYIQDRLPKKFRHRNQVHHQMKIGSTFILSEGSYLGFVVVDPTRTNPGDERIIIGFQQAMTSSLMLIVDGGAQYSKDIKENSLWNVAIQVNVLEDLFLRGGKFYDNVTKFRGYGYGVGWVGPRFGVEFAQKFSDSFGKPNYLYKKESLLDTAISAILKF